jgi:hypothetical protein
MSALQAVCRKTLLIEPHQDALIVFVRIGEIQNAPDRDLVYAGNDLKRRLASTRAQKVLDNYPELPDCESKTCQHQEFCEISPSDVMVLWPVDRKILTPLWLLGIRTTIRRNSVICLAVSLVHKTSFAVPLRPGS